MQAAPGEAPFEAVFLLSQVRGICMPVCFTRSASRGFKWFTGRGDIWGEML